MQYVPALFANGKVVTGTNHGDAFSKLDVQEQDGSITSGFIDPNSNKFFSDNQEIYLKEIILLRHAHVDDYFDPGISGLGHSQCDKVANFLYHNFPIKEFIGFSSCCNRTRETAQFIFGRLQVPFQTNPDFCEPKNWDLPCCKAADQWYESNYAFLERLKRILEYLPPKSIIVSHRNFIVNLAQQCVGQQDIMTLPQWKGKIPHCSLTYVKYNGLAFIGETDVENLKI